MTIVSKNAEDKLHAVRKYMNVLHVAWKYVCMQGIFYKQNIEKSWLFFFKKTQLQSYNTAFRIRIWNRQL